MAEVLIRIETDDSFEVARLLRKIATRIDGWEGTIPSDYFLPLLDINGNTVGRLAMATTPDSPPVGHLNYYELTADDVRQTTIKAFGRTWCVSSFLGTVLPGDVGKRVYQVGDILQVENNAQRDRRLADDV